jgi:hypothetical protein
VEHIKELLQDYPDADPLPILSSMQAMSRGNWPWLGVLYMQPPSPNFAQGAAFTLMLLNRLQLGDIRYMDIPLLALIPPPGSNLIRSIRLRTRSQVVFVCELGTNSAWLVHWSLITVYPW